MDNRELVPDMRPEEVQVRHKNKAVLRSKGYRPRRQKRKFIACLLSALFPGMGHLYLSMFVKGASLIYFVLIDSAALIFFSSVRGGINIPLLILLGLLLPIAYFYSIYDVLQSADIVNHKHRREIEDGDEAVTSEGKKSSNSGVLEGLAAGMLLSGGGVIVTLFLQKPFWLEKIIENTSAYVVSTILILAGIMLILREGRRRYLRTGRFTAALLLLVIGNTLFMDQLYSMNSLYLLRNWWPVILVLGGVEHIVVLLWNRKKTGKTGFRLRVDIRGLILAVSIAFSVFAVTQQAHYLHLWNRVSLDLTAAGAEFSEETGYSMEKLPIDVPIDLTTEQIVLSGLNGKIEVRTAPIDFVRIRTKVWVDELPEEEAKLVAEASNVEVTEGDSLNLSVKDALYGASGKRHPRMDITLILPENRFLDLDIKTSRGDITLTDVQAMKEMKIQTGSGNLKLWDVVGDITGKTLNGDVELYRIFGRANVTSNGGNMKGRGITGDVVLSSLVGNISLNGAESDIEVSTKNGNLMVDGAEGTLRAESLNGRIFLKSQSVGGDWDVYSAVGEMQIELPEVGNYKVEGSSGYGGIHSDLPFLHIENMEIKGEVGSGEHLIRIDGNSSLFVSKS